MLKNNSLVDNAFSVPVTEGYGEIAVIKGILEAKGFLDSLVNGKPGLPSAAGHNTAIFNGTQRVADAEEVAKG